MEERRLYVDAPDSVSSLRARHVHEQTWGSLNIRRPCNSDASFDIEGKAHNEHHP